MRTACLAIVLALVACKDKQQPKPAAATPPAPTSAAPAAQPPHEADTTETTEAAEAPAAPAIEPAGGIATLAEYEQKANDLLDKLTDVFASSGTNCDKLADNLEVFLDENQAALESTDAFEAANPTAQTDFKSKMQDKARRFITTANASMQACQKHERVRAALAKLPD